MRLTELQAKDVIDVCTGSNIGFIVDVVIDQNRFCIVALVVESCSIIKSLCFFKEPGEIVVPVEDIECVGEDVVLVRARQEG